MSGEDGGAAFPRPSSGSLPNVVKSQSGMTMRDYFAAAALQGVMTKPNLSVKNAGLIAADVYLMADAMLAERAK